MTEFNITERKEPFTIDEVFSFIDDTNISKMDAHELKSRIADVVQEVRNQSEEELKFLKQWKSDVMNGFCKYDASSVEEIAEHARNRGIDEFAERMKALRDKYTDDCFVHKMMAIDEVLEIVEEMRGAE